MEGWSIQDRPRKIVPKTQSAPNPKNTVTITNDLSSNHEECKKHLYLFDPHFQKDCGGDAIE